MFDIWSILVGLVTLLCCIAGLDWYKEFRNPGSLPGPRCLPILGNIVTFIKIRSAKSMCVEISKLACIYGSHFRLKLGSQYVVFVTGKEAIREAWLRNGDSLSGRHFFPMITKHLSNGKGVVMCSEPKVNKEIRKFMVPALRNFGVGKRSIESKIQNEAKQMTEYFISQKGIPFDVEEICNKGVANVISNVIFGNRFEYNDSNFISLLNNLTTLFQNYGTPILPYTMLPLWVSRLFTSTIDDTIISHEGIRSFIKKKIQEHRSSFDANNIRDLCDLYIQGNYSDVIGDNLIQTMLDLFLAGTETTSSSVWWACLLLVKYPTIQGKLYTEIQEVLGDREACLDDKENMPYSSAFIMELTRISSVVPLALLRRALTDIKVGEVIIPRGSLVAPNLYQMHHNDQDWNNPHSFNPERWLTQTEAGKIKLINHTPEAYLPFGLGPRKCIGESLSRSELFLMIIGIVQRNRLIPGEILSNQLELTEMLTRHPSNFKLIAIPR